MSWMKMYQTFLGLNIVNNYKNDVFQMGEKDFKTIVCKRIPVKIGELLKILEVGIIYAKISLLISEGKLKEWNYLIDFEEGTLHVRKTGEIIKLKYNTICDRICNIYNRE